MNVRSSKVTRRGDQVDEKVKDLTTELKKLGDKYKYIVNRLNRIDSPFIRPPPPGFSPKFKVVLKPIDDAVVYSMTFRADYYDPDIRRWVYPRTTSDIRWVYDEFDLTTPKLNAFGLPEWRSSNESPDVGEVMLNPMERLRQIDDSPYAIDGVIKPLSEWDQSFSNAGKDVPDYLKYRPIPTYAWRFGEDCDLYYGEGYDEGTIVLTDSDVAPIQQADKPISMHYFTANQLDDSFDSIIDDTPIIVDEENGIVSLWNKNLWYRTELSSLDDTLNIMCNNHQPLNIQDGVAKRFIRTSSGLYTCLYKHEGGSFKRIDGGSDKAALYKMEANKIDSFDGCYAIPFGEYEIREQLIERRNVSVFATDVLNPEILAHITGSVNDGKLYIETRSKCDSTFKNVTGLSITAYDISVSGSNQGISFCVDDTLYPDSSNYGGTLGDVNRFTRNIDTPTSPGFQYIVVMNGEFVVDNSRDASKHERRIFYFSDSDRFNGVHKELIHTPFIVFSIDPLIGCLENTGHFCGHHH